MKTLIFGNSDKKKRETLNKFVSSQTHRIIKLENYILDDFFSENENKKTKKWSSLKEKILKQANNLFLSKGKKYKKNEILKFIYSEIESIFIFISDFIIIFVESYSTFFELYLINIFKKNNTKVLIFLPNNSFLDENKKIKLPSFFEKEKEFGDLSKTIIKNFKNNINYLIKPITLNKTNFEKNELDSIRALYTEFNKRDGMTALRNNSDEIIEFINSSINEDEEFDFNNLYNSGQLKLFNNLFSKEEIINFYRKIFKEIKKWKMN